MRPKLPPFPPWKGEPELKKMGEELIAKEELIARKLIRGRPQIMRGIAAVVTFPFVARRLSDQVQEILDNLRL